MSKKKFFEKQAKKEGLSKEQSKELYLLAVGTNSNLNAKEAIEKHLKKTESKNSTEDVETEVQEEKQDVVVKKSKTSKK
jgi:hypothetical protein